MVEYAHVYGVSDRTIKSWVQIGKKLVSDRFPEGDLPPLDYPKEMPAWRTRCMPNCVADGVLLAAQGEPPSPQTARSTTAEPPLPPPPPPPRDFSNVEGLDIERNVAELRKTLAINKQLLDEALQGHDENLISLRQRNYKDLLELLRKAEDTLATLRKTSGDWIEKSDVRTDLVQFLEALRFMRQTMSARILVELQKISTRPMSRILRLLGHQLPTVIERVCVKDEKLFLTLETIDGPETLADQLRVV